MHASGSYQELNGIDWDKPLLDVRPSPRRRAPDSTPSCRAILRANPKEAAFTGLGTMAYEVVYNVSLFYQGQLKRRGGIPLALGYTGTSFACAIAGSTTYALKYYTDKDLTSAERKHNFRRDVVSLTLGDLSWLFIYDGLAALQNREHFKFFNDPSSIFKSELAVGAAFYLGSSFLLSYGSECLIWKEGRVRDAISQAAVYLVFALISSYFNQVLIFPEDLAELAHPSTWKNLTIDVVGCGAAAFVSSFVANPIVDKVLDFGRYLRDKMTIQPVEDDEEAIEELGVVEEGEQSQSEAEVPSPRILQPANPGFRQRIRDTCSSIATSCCGMWGNWGRGNQLLSLQAGPEAQAPAPREGRVGSSVTATL